MVFMWFKSAEWPINPAFSRNLKPPPFRRWSIHYHLAQWVFFQKVTKLQDRRFIWKWTR